MKKAWIGLLLVNVVSVSSMDKKVTINNPYYNQVNEIHLQPIYRPEEQKKPLLKKTSSQNNGKIQQSLYDVVYKIVSDTHYNKLQQDQQTRRFIEVIDQINKAKKHDIDEDRMGQFAYNKSQSWYFLSQHIPLVFSLFKRYNRSINATQEEIPYKIANYYTTKLSCTFGIENAENNHIERPTFEDLLKTYPAYVQLTNTLQELVGMSFNSTLSNLTACLYTDENILFTGYSDGSYTNLLDDFYTKAYKLLFEKGSCVDLYETLITINKAKQLKAINKESDLGYEILNFDPTNSSLSKKLLKKLQKKDGPNNGDIIHTKNLMALLCHLIEKYNNTDTQKKRPTPKQYFCYEKQKEFNLILPSSSTVFDENCYAFTAFEQLKNNYITLGSTPNRQQIELWVNSAYPNK